MNLIDIKDINTFHDSKLGDIVYDYRNKRLTIELNMDSKSNKGEYLLKAYDVKFFCSKIIEPWGKGIYLTELEYITKNALISVCIKLNSGDDIDFIANTICLDTKISKV